MEKAIITFLISAGLIGIGVTWYFSDKILVTRGSKDTFIKVCENAGGENTVFRIPGGYGAACTFINPEVESEAPAN